MNLEDCILYENENSGLDFKAIQYKKNKFSDLLIDVIAMANADISGERFIIIGVNHHTSGERDILGINEKFIDSATYQQLINENIEPELKIEYSPLKIKNCKVGIFKILDCHEQPYMMKKDYNTVRKGDSFIRKGTHQTRITRNDLDRIFSKKLTKNNFDGKIDLFFKDTNSNLKVISAIDELQYPSDIAAEKIQKLIRQKEKDSRSENDLTGLRIKSFPSVLGYTSYEERDLETLKKNLKDIKETYREEDLHYLFEQKGEKINIIILNNGDKYLEDASIQIKIKKDEGFAIADRIYEKPIQRNILDPASAFIEPSFDSINYPSLNEDKNYYMFFENLKNLRHLIPTDVFDVPIRIVAGQQLIGKDILFDCKLFGKNLIKPIEFNLNLKIK